MLPIVVQFCFSRIHLRSEGHQEPFSCASIPFKYDLDAYIAGIMASIKRSAEVIVGGIYLPPVTVRLLRPVRDSLQHKILLQ